MEIGPDELAALDVGLGNQTRGFLFAYALARGHHLNAVGERGDEAYSDCRIGRKDAVRTTAHEYVVADQPEPAQYRDLVLKVGPRRDAVRGRKAGQAVLQPAHRSLVNALDVRVRPAKLLGHLFHDLSVIDGPARLAADLRGDRAAPRAGLAADGDCERRRRGDF